MPDARRDTMSTDRPAGERPTLEQVLRGMPDDLRVVFMLREVEGYSHDDIGALTGIGAAASEARLHRARRYLQDRLGGAL